MLVLDMMTALIDNAYPIGPSTAGRLAVTGEPYVQIGMQLSDEGCPAIPGTVDEGKRSVWALNEEAACVQALASFETYAAERTGTLYWRQRPMLDKDESTGHCKVYMRLLISDAKEMAA